MMMVEDCQLGFHRFDLNFTQEIEMQAMGPATAWQCREL